MKSTFLLFLFLLPAFVFGQTESFVSECNEAGLSFNMPEGYKATSVKENGDLYYSFAVVNPDKSMEIRYTIWPLNNLIKEYEQSLNDPKRTMISPNSIYKGRIQANVLNMTGGVMYDIGPFPAQAVMNEFKADAGGSCFFEFNCEFGKGYKYGQFIYLHKDNIADVIITFMSNDKQKHSDLMLTGFHSLTFK